MAGSNLWGAHKFFCRVKPKLQKFFLSRWSLWLDLGGATRGSLAVQWYNFRSPENVHLLHDTHQHSVFAQSHKEDAWNHIRPIFVHWRWPEREPDTINESNSGGILDHTGDSDKYVYYFPLLQEAPPLGVYSNLDICEKHCCIFELRATPSVHKQHLLDDFHNSARANLRIHLNSNVPLDEAGSSHSPHVIRQHSWKLGNLDLWHEEQFLTWEAWNLNLSVVLVHQLLGLVDDEVVLSVHQATVSRISDPEDRHPHGDDEHLWESWGGDYH